MRPQPPTRKLRKQPDPDQLKRQAKELLDAYADGDAVVKVEHHFQNADRASFALHHAQLVIARAYGFDSFLCVFLRARSASAVNSRPLVQ